MAVLRLLTLLMLVPLVAHAKPTSAPTKGAESFEVLRDNLPDDPAKRLEQLQAFAREDRAALSDRLLAVSAWQRALPRDDASRADADLYEAHLRAVGLSESQRRRALRRALATLQKGTRGQGGSRGSSAAAIATQSRIDDVQTLIAADAAWQKLEASAQRRRKKPARSPSSSLEATWQTALTEALDGGAHTRLKDDRRRAEIEVTLALFLELTDIPRGDVDRALSRLVRVGGRSRDTGDLRVAVRRARSRVLAESAKWEEALHEALVADRAVGVPVHEAAFEIPTPPAYRRTKETAELCFTARASGILCEKIEEERMGELSFYDFSVETRPAFDPVRAEMALKEFQPLLRRCIREETKRGNLLDNTTVELEWSIGSDGKVSTSSVLPRRLRETPFEACIKGSFERFRYPRYRGEMQHTQLSFDIGS